MIGPYIDRRYMLGGWSFTGNPEDVITIKNAAEEKLADYEIVYAQGCPILSEDVKLEGFANYTEEKFSQEDCEKMKEEALRAAKEADVVVLAIGEHFLQSGEATSKGIIEIPKIQQELFEALSEVNSEIAVVLFNGRPLDIRILEERAKAILEVWMPGTMGGAAIVEVLRGAVSPAGKLPMSFPYCVSQVPSIMMSFLPDVDIILEKIRIAMSRNIWICRINHCILLDMALHIPNLKYQI